MSFILGIHLIDNPECIATSCDINEHIESLETMLNNVGEMKEALSQISNYECISTDSVLSSLPSMSSPPTPSPPTPSPPTSSPIPAACGQQCKAAGVFLLTRADWNPLLLRSLYMSRCHQPYMPVRRSEFVEMWYDKNRNIIMPQE